MNMSPIRCFTFALFLTMVACGGGGGSSTPPPPSLVPTISGVNPSHGSPGTAVVITGAFLNGATSVSFNGRAAFSFSVASTTEIDAVVPGSANSGAIQVTTPNGSATSPAFAVDAAMAPGITSYTPSVLSAGTVVTLTGTHFVGATQVQFNGAAAASFSVASDTQIQATAPGGLTAGIISVTTPGGTATSSSSYTVGQLTSAQVLMNTGFEQTSPIIWQGDTGVIYPIQNTTYTSHGGSYFAYLGGYGTVASDHITQDLYVPATAQSANVAFYLKIITSEPGSVATDSLSVAAWSTSNVPLGTLLTRSNANAADYTLYTVDLLPYKGQVVRLSFTSQEDAQNQTSFLLDDVLATIVAPPADLTPIITSFTPTSGIAGEQTVQIAGKNFFGLTAVTIGGINASYVLTDGTALSATVSAGAATGSAPIRITNAQGTGSAASNFTVAYGVPTIIGVNPAQGPVGTPVVITGTYLGYPGTTVTLNGQPIPLATQTVNQITFTVPVGATTGSLVINTPGGSVTRTFTVNTVSATLDLHIDKVELTQSTQTLDNSVPIVAGKDGLVRVFVLANQTNSATPAVQVTLMNNGLTVFGYPKTITAPGTNVPTALNEGTLSASWNLAVPGTDLTTPTGTGYSIQAVVDPTGAVPEADKTNNATSVSLSGTTVPIFKTTIFPVALSTGTGNISEANKAQWVARLAKMYPIGSVDVIVGVPFTPTTPNIVSTLSSDNLDSSWSNLLIDLQTKHLADATSDRYYFGAVNVSYSSGVAGLGYVPPSPSYSYQYRTAIGWDKTGYKDGGNYPEVFAHETGHNMGRQHSPCGGASSPDPAYPYASGLIGVWGYDNVLNQLYSPLTYEDIMGYCTPDWVSDYVYKEILNFRNGTGGFLLVGAEDNPLPKNLAVAQECLLVRGIVHDDGKVEMLPSFRTKALPSKIPSEGDYTLECLDQQGLPVFTAPIELMEVGCSPKGYERHFVMALPLTSGVLDSIIGLNVLKGGQVQATLRSASSLVRSIIATPEFRRLGSDRVQLTWDATIHPAALIRDADSGEVIAILSGGTQTLQTRAQRFDLVLSDGVSGQTHHLEIPD